MKRLRISNNTVGWGIDQRNTRYQPLRVYEGSPA